MNTELYVDNTPKGQLSLELIDRKATWHTLKQYLEENKKINLQFNERQNIRTMYDIIIQPVSTLTVYQKNTNGYLQEYYLHCCVKKPEKEISECIYSGQLTIPMLRTVIMLIFTKALHATARNENALIFVPAKPESGYEPRFNCIPIYDILYLYPGKKTDSTEITPSIKNCFQLHMDFILSYKNENVILTHMDNRQWHLAHTKKENRRETTKYFCANEDDIKQILKQIFNQLVTAVTIPAKSNNTFAIITTETICRCYFVHGAKDTENAVDIVEKELHQNPQAHTLDKTELHQVEIYPSNKYDHNNILGLISPEEAENTSYNHIYAASPAKESEEKHDSI